MRKKNAGQPADSPKTDQQQPGKTSQPVSSAPQKTLTFEDLLREITEAKRPKEEPVVDYDDELAEEEQDLEEVDYDYRKDNKVYETYEEAKRQAFNRPSLEETMKVENTVVSFGKFKVFEQAAERNLAAEYLKDFKDPQGFKKAVVLSEILKRKF
jgi:hypothetical protein